MFKREFLNRIPKSEFYNITDLMEDIVKEGYKLIHNPIVGYWIDIGSPGIINRLKNLSNTRVNDSNNSS